MGQGMWPCPLEEIIGSRCETLLADRTEAGHGAIRWDGAARSRIRSQHSRVVNAEITGSSGCNAAGGYRCRAYREHRCGSNRSRPSSKFVAALTGSATEHTVDQILRDHSRHWAIAAVAGGGLIGSLSTAH